MSLMEAYDYKRDDENEAPKACLTCDGAGGYDASRNVEEYDDWQECQACDGSGIEQVGDVFDPRVDAWTAND